MLRVYAALSFTLTVLLFASLIWQSEDQQGVSGIAETPQPTLTSGQAGFEQLLQTNGGCELPCWWGFHIGETSEDEWQDFLDNAPFYVIQEDALLNGAPISLDGSGYFRFPNSSETSVMLEAQLKGGVLSQLNVRLRSVQDWLSPNVDSISLGNLLARLGENTQIYIDGNTSFLNLHFLIINEEKSFEADYWLSIWDLQDKENYLEIQRYCLGLKYTTGIDITLYDPAAQALVSERYKRILMGEDSQYLAPEEFPGVDMAEFIQFFAQHPDECLFVNRERTPNTSS